MWINVIYIDVLKKFDSLIIEGLSLKLKNF